MEKKDSALVAYKIIRIITEGVLVSRVYIDYVPVHICNSYG